MAMVNRQAHLSLRRTTADRAEMSLGFRHGDKFFPGNAILAEYPALLVRLAIVRELFPVELLEMQLAFAAELGIFFVSLVIPVAIAVSAAALQSRLGSAVFVESLERQSLLADRAYLRVFQVICFLKARSRLRHYVELPLEGFSIMVLN